MRYKEDVIPLLEVPVSKTVRLKNARDSVHGRLTQYGLHVGDCLRVLRVAPMGGPLLIEVSGREIALGRSIAEMILVEAECEPH